MSLPGFETDRHQKGLRIDLSGIRTGYLTRLSHHHQLIQV
jgi:hypothetical protein